MKMPIILIAALFGTAAYAAEDFGSDYWKTVAVKIGTYQSAKTLCPLKVDAEASGFLDDMQGQLQASPDLLARMAEASAVFTIDWKRDAIAACSTVQADIDTLATAKLPAKR